MSKAGAPAAYRGYRLQALYTIKRILTQGSDDLIFHPEGKEDLDILDANGHLLEAIQVKSYNSLSLSDLEPAKKDSFFRRVINLLKNSAPSGIKLVNFGPIGPEMRQAWSNSTPKEQAKRESITKKLKDKGFKDSQISKIFAHVELVQLFEKPEEAEVYKLLRDMLIGIDAENAFDLLNHWIYRASEAQRQITKDEIIEKISQVGHFLAERRAHHAEWFTSIRPIATRLVPDEQRITLRNEFYEGVSARYEHILADLDFRRDAKLAEITQCFERSNVVIIDAASGQGKTTLAYRYLHDSYPENWRFSIELIENRQHALSIATALSGHANAIQAPMAVYIDVRPSDTAWPELVRQLARHPYLNVLVTVREEDFQRASVNLPRTEFDFEEIDLAFNENEARLIFARAIESQPSAKYLDFEAAWNDFGGNGPLMEFVYLLTQAATLRQRLKEQVQRLRHETRERKLSPNELHLLRLVAVATAYEARLHIRPLVKSLRLPEPSLTFELFEKEYLIRLSDNKRCIEALHPIRSRILVDLLTDQDFNPWLDIATNVLPLLLEEDLENFILHAFVDRPEAEYKPFLTVVQDLQPTTWTGIAGVLRSLLWAGVRDYIEANRHLIEIIRKDKKDLAGGWFIILDFDLTNILGDSNLINSLWSHIPKWKQEKITQLRQSQPPKSDAFKPAYSWLSSLNNPPRTPLSDLEWMSVAEVLYWTAHLRVAPHIERWLTNDQLAIITRELPFVIIADLSVTLYMCNQKRHESWMQANRKNLEARLAHEYQIFALEEDENSLKIHFLPLPIEELSEQDVESGKSKLSDQLRAATIERVELVHRLFPMYELYSSQGYSHKLGSIQLPLDITATNIPLKNLTLPWPKSITRIAGGLAGMEYRLDTWTEYANRVLEIRKLIAQCMLQSEKAILKFLQGKAPKDTFPKYVDATQWDICKEWLNEIPKFPKCALDQWGFASENASNSSLKENAYQQYLPRAIAWRKYKAYITAQRNYLNSMNLFFKQYLHVMSTNSLVGRWHQNVPKRGTIIANLEQRGFKTNQAHSLVRNFWKAVRSLSTYQAEFRKLFGHLVDSDSLTNLERREQKVLPKTWQLWYFFSYYPHERVPKADKAIRRKVARTKRELDQKIKKALSKVRSKGTKVTILNPDMSWNNSPTLWLRLDLNDPTQLYGVFEKLVGSLKTKLGPRDVKSLTDYLIEEYYEYTVIVPVIRGRMLNEFVWALFTATTLLSTESIEQKILSYIPQPFPSEMRKALGLKLWDLEDVILANQLYTSISVSMILVTQMSELVDLPEANVTEEGLVVLKNHVAQQSENLTKWLQGYLDTGATLFKRFSTLPKPEQERREKLLQAATILAQIGNEVLPSENNGLHIVSLDKMGEYAQNLEKAFIPTETARLFWIADVLEQHLTI